ncbi:hypothetical protein MHYP_G00146330 [Metynnis hypsauchen]
MCVIEDFYPKPLSIMWKKNNHEVRGRDWKTTENDSGSYTAVSVLDENLASSSPGTKYTCEVTHGGRTYSKNLSPRGEFSLKINPPQAKDLFLNRKAVIECVLTGDSRKEVEGATVSWTVGGRSPATRDVRVGGVTQTGSSFTKTSTLTLKESIWFSGADVICYTSVDQRTTSDKISVKRGGQRPSIIIYKPDKSVSDSDSVSLVCEVSSSDLANVYIMWQVNGGQYKEGNSMTTIVKNDNTLMVLSYLSVTGQQYNSAEITCAVKDANIQNDFQPRTSSPSKTNSPPTIRLVEFGQSIMCIIEDFYPKSLRIKWKKDDREVQGRDWKTTENDSGSYRAVSVLEANLASSSPGTKYTCEVTHRGRTYSENLSSKVQSSLKINPPQAKDLFLNRKAVIECVLSGDSRKEVEGATVSWTVGGRSPATRDVRVGGVTQAGSSFTKTSTLTLEESIWFSGAEVICYTSVDQRTTSDKISVKRGGQRPSIIIYKPDKTVSDSDMVSLVCEISSSDLANVYVMWQVNGGQYKEGNSMTTIVKKDNTLMVLSYLTVTGQQYNSAEITCAVKDANIQNDFQPRTSSPSKTNSPPTIRLVEFGQSIMCIIEDFYPKCLRIKWKKDDREVQGRDWKTTENDSGSYRVVSVLEANLASSSPGTKYTCEVTHRGRTYSENLSSKVQSSLKINPPQAKDLFLNRKAVIECVLSGDSRKEVEGATVSWTVGGRSPATRDVRVGGVTQAGLAFTKTSTLTLEESIWFSGAEVICSTSVDQRTTSDKISVKRGGQRPSIIIYKPDKTVSDSDTVSLVCEVSSSDLANVYVMWQVNGGQYEEGNSMTTIVKKDNTVMVLSYLTVTGQQYNSAEITCAVKDANIQNDFQLRTSSPSKTNSPPTIRLVEFGQSIMCIIEDFYAKSLRIKWKKDDREVQGQDWKTTENDSGSYRAVSVLEANLASSSPGTKYTCEVTHRGRTYSENLSSKVQSSLKINPPQAKDLFLNRKAVIECVLTGDSRKEVEGATVSWTVGGRSPATRDVRVGGVTQTGLAFTKTSTLTLEESIWFSGAEVICYTSVDRRTTSDKISVKRGGQRPSIIIYKPDKSVSDSDSVSLVCEVSSSDLANLYVMWQVNGGQYKEGNSMTTIVKNDNTLMVLSYLTVTGQQYNSAEITCAVKDANIQNDFQPRTSSPSKTNSPPTIRLVEFGQSIMCIIEDFYPKCLRIKWKKDDREVQGRDWKTTENDSGSYRAVSVLEANLASSSPGTKYTCEVTHRGRTYSENLSSKVQSSLKINPPQAKDLFLNRKAVIECVLSGDSRKEVEGATVSWTVGGRSPATRDVRVGGVTQAGLAFTKTSTLTLEESIWFSGAEVICSTSVDQRTTSDKISVKRGGQRPSIIIYKPDKTVSDSDTVSLVCEVSSSDLANVYVMWQVNGGQYEEGNSMTTIVKKDNTVMVLSYLTVTGQQYNSAEITCAVKDANIQNDFQLRTSSPSKTNSPPTIRLVEFGQSIMCIIEDFYAKSLRIKWKKDDREVQGQDWKTTENDSGSYRAVSVLEANLASSSPGTKYTCEVTHRGRTYSENLSSKVQSSLKINPPQAKDLFLNRKAVIECVLTGDSRKEVEGATVSWTVGGRSPATRDVRVGGVTQTGLAFTKTSTLTLEESIWFSGAEVICYTSVDRRTTSDKISVKRGGQRPSIIIYKPDKSVSDSDSVSLVCEVSSSDLANLYVMWQVNGGQYKEGNSMTTIVKNDNTLMVLSYLSVTGQQYNSAEITCAVKDANIQNDFQPRTSSPSKTNSPPTIRLVEFGQSIMCIIEDFYPKSLRIKWKKDDREVQGRDWKTTENDSGSYRAVSVLEANLASSSPGTKYTCEVTHRGRTYSENLSSKVQSSLKINPPQAKDLFLNRKAVIECVLSGDSRKEVEGATVSWTVGGRSPATRDVRVGGVTQTGLAFTKTSTLTLEESVWFSGAEVICYTSVDQRTTSDKISVKRGGQRPSIIIYKTDKSVSDSDSVSLVCEVSSSDHANVYVMWQVNGANSPPTIRLVEFGQSIMCIIEDFYPKSLRIKWKKDDHEVQGRDWKTTENDSGSYRAVSVLEANLASSSPGTKYTCEVTHKGRTYSENLSSKVQSSLKINPPQAKDLFLNRKAVIECVLSGDSRKEVEGATVSWTAGGRSPATRDVRVGGVTQAGSAFTKTSTLALEESIWFSGAEVICSTSVDQRTTSDKISVKRGGQRPSIIIYKPDKSVSDSDSVSLVCEVSSSDLANVYVMWQVNSGQYIEGNSMTTIIKKDNTLMVLSYLTVTGQQYNSAEISCVVKDANMQNDTQPRIRRTAKRSIVNRRTLSQVSRAGQASGSTAHSEWMGDPSVELSVVPSVGKSELQKLLCIGTGSNPEIKWLSKAGPRTGASSNVLTQADGRVKVSSEIEVALEEWNKGEEFTCQVSDLQKTVEKKTSVCAAHPSVAPPIRLEKPRLFNPSLQPHSAVTASCVAEAAPNSRVSWVLSGNVEKKASKEMTDERPNSNTRIFVSKLTLPAREWEQHQNVTCRVKQPCNDLPEEKTVNVLANSPPTIHLLKFGQSIMCILEDFYPKALSIKWKKNDHEVRGRDWTTTENDSGSYRAVSVLDADMISSSPGAKYTCEAIHGGKTYTERLSSRAQFSLKINPPQAKDLFINHRAVIECVITGDSRKEVEGATVSWTVGVRNPATRDVRVGGVTQAGSAFTKTSTLTLEESVWFSGAEVICSTSRHQITTSDKISVKRGGQRPSIIIYKPHKSVLVTDMVSLICEVSSSDLRDVFIMWQVNGGQYIEGHSMTSIKKDNTLTVLSYLTVPGQQYNHAEFACAVKQANMENSYTLTTRTTSMRKTNCQAPAIMNIKVRL